MDRFRFRVWDSVNKTYLDEDKIRLNASGKLYYFIQDDTSPKTSLLLEGLWVLANIDNRFKVEQCTGIKDKNGKLIFEGDTINVSNQYNKVVIFQHAQFGHIGNTSFYSLSHWVRPIKIIGNIHEIKNYVRCRDGNIKNEINKEKV